MLSLSTLGSKVKLVNPKKWIGIKYFSLFSGRNYKFGVTFNVWKKSPVKPSGFKDFSFRGKILTMNSVIYFILSKFCQLVTFGSFAHFI